MIHTYSLEGITCSSCAASIKSELLKLPDVLKVEVNETANEATIEMEKHISIARIQQAVSIAGTKYFIREIKNGHGMNGKTTAAPMSQIGSATEEKTWLRTYKPVLLLFGMITLVSVAVDINSNGFEWMNSMRLFMSGFFLSFSFFKFLDLRGFVDSYSSYDIIAKRFRAWGFVYAFVELLLGMLYAVNREPLITNTVTFVVMSVSIIGVLQSVVTKQKIQCACLGTVFNLPMSTVTIIEDALMIAMSGIMITKML